MVDCFSRPIGNLNFPVLHFSLALQSHNVNVPWRTIYIYVTSHSIYMYFSVVSMSDECCIPRSVNANLTICRLPSWNGLLLRIFIFLSDWKSRIELLYLQTIPYFFCKCIYSNLDEVGILKLNFMRIVIFDLFFMSFTSTLELVTWEILMLCQTLKNCILAFLSDAYFWGTHCISFSPIDTPLALINDVLPPFITSLSWY